MSGGAERGRERTGFEMPEARHWCFVLVVVKNETVVRISATLYRLFCMKVDVPL